MCTYCTLQYTVFFNFVKCLTPNTYLPFTTLPYFFAFSSTVFQMRTYCTLQYQLFLLFKVLYTKCITTVHYTTHYFHLFKHWTQNVYLLYATVHLVLLFQVLYIKCILTVQYSTPYLYLSSAVHQMYTYFSGTLHQIRTYCQLQFTLYVTSQKMWLFCC